MPTLRPARRPAPGQPLLRALAFALATLALAAQETPANNRAVWFRIMPEPLPEAVNALALEASSGAALRLTGACTDLRASASSGAQLDSAGLHCKTADLTVSSGANVRVWAETSVRGEASSGGSILVQGKPSQVSSRQSSGGRLRVDPA